MMAWRRLSVRYVALSLNRLAIIAAAESVETWQSLVACTREFIIEKDTIFPLISPRYTAFQQERQSALIHARRIRRMKMCDV